MNTHLTDLEDMDWSPQMPTCRGKASLWVDLCLRELKWQPGRLPVVRALAQSAKPPVPPLAGTGSLLSYYFFRVPFYYLFIRHRER